MPRTLSGILRATERWVAGKTPSITTLRCPQCHDHGSGRRSNWEMPWPHMPRASRGHSYTEHAMTCTHGHQGDWLLLTKGYKSGKAGLPQNERF